ncbi:MAG: ATP-dependent zinc protease [Paludibacteraceae bacterium]|nr:ATP-dependent zinc protease [Paludibacteraceae bacterium]
MTYLDFLEQKVLLERLVIGLEEPVLIKGLGELSAKIDSGNGGYNVIHGTDFHQQGSELMFTTHDDKGNEKKIQAKVIDTIEINMGGGNIENRPVIELDIKFAGEDYKKIPFSVSDRSTNTNPILISKGFVENELKALIDVSATNISNDGIDVVYGESLEGKADQTAKKWDDSKAKKALKMGITAGKAGVEAGKSVTKGAWGALKTLGRGAMGAADWLKGGEDKSLLEPVYGAANMAKDIAKGVGGAIAALGGRFVWKKICDGAKSIVHAEEILVTDKNAIRSKLSNTAIP